MALQWVKHDSARLQSRTCFASRGKTNLSGCSDLLCPKSNKVGHQFLWAGKTLPALKWTNGFTLLLQALNRTMTSICLSGQSETSLEPTVTLWKSPNKLCSINGGETIHSDTTCNNTRHATFPFVCTAVCRQNVRRLLPLCLAWQKGTKCTECTAGGTSLWGNWMRFCLDVKRHAEALLRYFYRKKRKAV